MSETVHLLALGWRGTGCRVSSRWLGDQEYLSVLSSPRTFEAVVEPSCGCGKSRVQNYGARSITTKKHGKTISVKEIERIQKYVKIGSDCSTQAPLVPICWKIWMEERAYDSW
jgi:hypothetical protein